MGKLLIIIGTILIIAGLLISFSDRIPFVGKLPGDLSIERDNFKLYVPITTSILLSIVISLVLYFVNRWRQ